uniref:Major facilitator superfamily (MFS) profile domain-containing protein n=1 Tax=Romanomermis culicivorax TaxID=13658 RepID=A0A915I7K7_ROMCU
MTFTVLIGGRLADYVLMKKWLTVVLVRKVFNSTGFLGEAGFLCVVAFSTNKTVSVACLVLAATMSGFSLSGFSVNQMDIGPKYAGVLMGLSNGLCNLSGVVGPVLIEYLTRNYGRMGWRFCFIISCGLHTLGVLVYLFWASGDEQDWSTMDEERKKPKNSKEKC